MNKVEQLSSRVIDDINKILERNSVMDEVTLNKIISDFVLLARIYNSQYNLGSYGLWGKGYDLIKLDLFAYLGFDRHLFNFVQKGNNFTLLFGQEEILAVRNIIFDRFSNEFMLSCKEKFDMPPIMLDFVMSKNFIFGLDETIQNAGDFSFITALDYLESGQKEKIRQLKYTYNKNDYSYNTVIIDRIHGIKIETTKDNFQVFEFDTRYLDGPVDFSIEGSFDEMITKLTDVRKVSENLVDSSNDSFTLVKKSE